MDYNIEGNIICGLMNNWSDEDKQRFIKDWLNDNFMLCANEITNNNSQGGICTEVNHDTNHAVDNQKPKDGNSTDAESDICPRRGRKRKIVFDSETQDNDSEIHPLPTCSVNSSSIDDDSELDINMQKKKKNAILDRESQDEAASTCTVTSVNPDGNSTDAESDLCPRRRKKKNLFDSQTQDNDSETYTPPTCSVNPSSTDDNSELYIHVQKKKKNRIFGSESQDESASTCTVTSVNPEVSTDAHFRRVKILDSQSVEDSSEFGQSNNILPSVNISTNIFGGQSGSEMNGIVEGTDGDGNDDGGDDDDDDDDNDHENNDVITSDYDDFIDDSDELIQDDMSTSSSQRSLPQEHLENTLYAYVHCMLNVCANPSFLDECDSQDEYREAKRKIEAELERLGNILRSEVWRRDFWYALETFPTLLCRRAQFKHEGCTACARPGRIVSKLITFAGIPYDPENFKIQGSSEPNEVKSFEVGRHCAARSMLYHRVFHYKFKLHQLCDETLSHCSGCEEAVLCEVRKHASDKKWMTQRWGDFSSLRTDVMSWFETDNRSRRLRNF